MNKIAIDPIPFRLTIGVTGHRTLQNPDAIRETVRKVLNKILSAYSGNEHTSVKLCALSPMAEGADRLIAQEILNYHEGSILQVVLPLTISDYLDDFTSEQSKQEFEHLMSEARSSLSLSERPLREEYPPELLEQARTQAYENVGRFMVNHCDVLIAVWDGAPSRGQGGTADVIAYAGREKCPVYIIPTDDPSSFQFHEGKGITDELLKKIDTFNSHITTSGASPDYVHNEFRTLFTNPEIPEGEKLSSQTKEIIKDTLIPYYTVASSMAKYYQKIYRRVGLLVFWLAFSAVALVGTGTVLLQKRPICFLSIFFIEFVFLIVILKAIRFADKKRSHKNWMEYRFLAERIRSAFFLYLGGVEISSVYINHRAKEGEGDVSGWMSIVFDEIWSSLPKSSAPCGNDLKVLKAYISKAWIDDQISFHEKTCRKNRKKSKGFEIGGSTIFYCALLASFLHIMFSLIFHYWLRGLHIPFLESFLTLCALVLPALAATFEAIRGHREYKRLSIRSRKMVHKLRALNESFTLLTPERFEKFLKEVDYLMLRETKDWFTVLSVAELYKAV
ncbi:MAG: hypothetical protein JXA79_11945 [Deltaproteobacteria bacterium]|nr:hypothetical protein [Deltaproteobacteria bacterium]